MSANRQEDMATVDQLGNYKRRPRSVKEAAIFFFETKEPYNLAGGRRMWNVPKQRSGSLPYTANDRQIGKRAPKGRIST